MVDSSPSRIEWPSLVTLLDRLTQEGRLKWKTAARSSIVDHPAGADVRNAYSVEHNGINFILCSFEPFEPPQQSGQILGVLSQLYQTPQKKVKPSARLFIRLPTEDEMIVSPEASIIDGLLNTVEARVVGYPKLFESLKQLAATSTEP